MGVPSTGERLLSIGEFSRLSQISIRMLRYYNEHGVLHPTRVDRHSGCRSYSPALLSVARWVRERRDIGLAVHEIAACVPVLDDPHREVYLGDPRRTAPDRAGRDAHDPAPAGLGRLIAHCPPRLAASVAPTARKGPEVDEVQVHYDTLVNGREVLGRQEGHPTALEELTATRAQVEGMQGTAREPS